jgi:predicted metal-binding protein
MFRRNRWVTVVEIPANPDCDVQDGAAPVRAGATVIYVCTTCRRPEDPEDHPRPGAALAAATARAAQNTDIEVQPLRCLANCKRGCSAILRRPDAWTYVFGHLDPERDAEALVQGAQLLAHATDGLLPWRGRPEVLKRNMMARVPPLNFQEQSE